MCSLGSGRWLAFQRGFGAELEGARALAHVAAGLGLACFLTLDRCKDGWVLGSAERR